MPKNIHVVVGETKFERISDVKDANDMTWLEMIEFAADQLEESSQSEE